MERSAPASAPRRPLYERLAGGGAGALLCLISFIWYRECILGFFFFDDFWVMRDAARIAPGDPWGIFRLSEVGFQLYRPLTTVGYLYVLREAFGYDASGYHAVQLVVFTINSLLAFAIARRLTNSVAAALGVGIIYLLAPGQAVGVYWLAAFTVTGTVCVMLLTLYCWLATTPPWRAWLCAALQIVGLLASEHAVTIPVLLGIIAAATQPRDRWRRLAREILPAAAIVGAYGVIKLWYFARVRPVWPGYRMGLDVVVWLQHLGQYTIACINAVTLLKPAEWIATSIGGALVVILIAAIWQSRRQRGPWSLLAAGLGVFVVSLAPVFPMRTHYKDHYIALAALGMALALVAACQLSTRRWRELILSIALGVLLLDVASRGRAWRRNPTFALVTNGGAIAAAWVHTVSRTAVGDGSASPVLVIKNPTTDSVFTMGQIQTYFPSLPEHVVVVKADQAAAYPGSVRVTAAQDLPRDAPLPGWEPRWAALRWMAGAAH